MNDNTQTIYSRRFQQAEESLAFAIKPELFLEGGMSNIVQMKRYFGLSRGEKLLLLPVFDEMCFSEDGSAVFGRISDQWILYDSYTGQELVKQSFESKPIYHQAHSTLEIIVDDHHHGLYDINKKKLLLNTEYDAVDCSAAFSHLWVKKGQRWGFVNKETGVETLVYDMDMAYEADGGLFLRHGNIIICIDENGVNDELALRRFVLLKNGRGMVHNARYHESVFFDVYGNILL